MRTPGASVLRAAGLAFCLAGIAVLAYAGWRYADGALRADQARRQWEAKNAALLVSQSRSRAFDVSPNATKPALGAPVARLTIPRIHLDDIVLEGVGDDELDAGPGHLPGSAMPGSRGNSVISAHRDRHFRHLDEVQVGDTVVTEVGLSKSSWIVVSRRVIDRGTPALFQTAGPTLTLTTCWPVRYFGSAPDRLILTARPLREPATGPRA